MLADKAKTAAQSDRQDALSAYRERFACPIGKDGERKCYLAGNSLGLQPDHAATYVQQVLDDWSSLGVEGHFHGSPPWMPYHRNATGGLARLLGCDASEVVAMNTLTINLNLLLLSFYRPTPRRYKILIEADAFPSDRYAVQSQLALNGFDPERDLVEWRGGRDGLTTESLKEVLAADEHIALALLPGVQYLTGEVLALEEMATVTQRFGVTLGADLAHAVGNVPLELSRWGVDFAVFCSYKYLNSGPGAVGGAYVHQKHHGVRDGQLHGWWGNRESTRFEMHHSLDPAPGIDLWQQSNPPILSMAPLLASLKLFDEVGMEALRRKSIALTGFLRELLTSHLSDSVQIITPEARQGAQLSLRIRTDKGAGKSVFSRLEAHEVICDWREPDIIRVAPAPFYNSFTDVWTFVQRLDHVLRRP